MKARLVKESYDFQRTGDSKRGLKVGAFYGKSPEEITTEDVLKELGFEYQQTRDVGPPIQFHNPMDIWINSDGIELGINDKDRYEGRPGRFWAINAGTGNVVAVIFNDSDEPADLLGDIKSWIEESEEDYEE